MATEHRDIKLGLSSVFDWSVWRANEKHTERTLNTFTKKQSQFHSEYENISAAYDTVIAFLLSALPEKKLECMRKFRSILESNPKHLNALTFMMNSKMVSESEKKEYVSAFTKGVDHAERHIIVGKACLELGMALVELEQIVDFEQTYDQLDKNVLFSQKSRNPVYHIEEIDNQLRSHLQFEKKNEQKFQIADTYAKLFTWTQSSIMRDRQMQAVRYLSEGINRVEDTLSEDELLVWKYYLAKAYKQLQFKSHRTGFEKHLHKQWTMKATQIFFDVIIGTDRVLNDPDQVLNENKKGILTTNKARCCVYIGEILHNLPQTEDRSKYCKCIQDPRRSDKIDVLLDTPSVAFEMAKSMQPDDITVLVRYGKYLLGYTRGTTKTPCQEESDVDMAIDMLSMAIKQDEGYWFAHSVRMSALKKKYKIKNHKHNPANIALLQDAERDGKFCFSSFPTVITLCEYSRILHWLADPRERGGDGINHDYLQKAIDVLMTIDSKFQHHNSALVYKERADCHNLKGEVKEALINIELAFYANIDTKVSIGLIKLCNYFTDAIIGGRLEETERNFAFRRLKTALSTMLKVEELKSDKCRQDDETMNKLDQYLEDFQRKCCNVEASKKAVNDVLYNLDNMVEKLEHNIAAENPIFHEVVQSNPNLVRSIFVCKILNCVSGWMDSLLSKYLDQQTVLRPSMLAMEEIFVSPGTFIQSSRNQRHPFNQTGKRYDFFVLHSDTDNDWVVCCLLQQLEYGQYGFKGCVQERDFEDGKTILENITDKMNESNKILIVISRNTPTTFLENLAKYHILKCLSVTGKHYKDTYVLNVGVEERPQQLINFQYIDCDPLPLDLNPVRDVLALPRPIKYLERPVVYIQPLREDQERLNILSAKCKVDEDRKISTSSILELGIPRVPIFETVEQVECAETTLKYGFPESNVVILYKRQVIYYDTEKGLAKWAAYKLRKKDIEGPGKRDDSKFQTDPRIQGGMQTSSLANFKGKLHKAHEVPAADSKASQSEMNDTFKFTNIYPEYNDNKLWSAVEVYIREKVLKDFKEAWIYIIPAFKSKDSDPFVTYSVVGDTEVAVPTHMFKFVIATSDSGDGTLVTGAFMVRNAKRYGCKELKKGNEPFEYVFDNEVKTDIKTIARDTGIRFDEMLKTNGHKYNEELLKECKFIMADEYIRYEEERINKNRAKNGK